MRGLFIVLEGIDGSGKTEQSRRLAAWLRETGRSVIETREPTDGEWGRRYRAWARGEIEASADEVLEFFVEDRREHVARLVLPALERGDDVVCDRYVASTLAYQAAHGVDRHKLRAATEGAAFPEPDLVVWLRLPVADALARLGSRLGSRRGSQVIERYERSGFLERVDAEYEALGLESTDAAGDVDQVARRIRARVERVSARADS
ncbi:MAG: dTMP kinase [Deltaproteobacteria bacterium]|nr:dTMP kinase [Deltaproteobacteria bacterium]